MKKLTIIILGVIVTTIILIVLFQTKEIKTENIPSESKVVENLGNRFVTKDLVLAKMPEYLTRESLGEKGVKFTDLAFQSAISTTTVSFNGCMPSVSGIKVDFDDVITLTNIGTSSITLSITNSSSTISSGASVNISVTDIFPRAKDFTAGRSVRIYTCDGAIGPIGYIVTGK